jgi:hypothetical protein
MNRIGEDLVGGDATKAVGWKTGCGRERNIVSIPVNTWKGREWPRDL